jgi:uncharacterized membrane protein
MVLCEKFPSSPLVRFHARHFQEQHGQLSDIIVGMLSEDFQTTNIIGRDVRLIEKAVKLIQTFDAVALLTWQTLTIFAYMIAMAPPGELLVATIAPADSAIVWHSLD